MYLCFYMAKKSCFLRFGKSCFTSQKYKCPEIIGMKQVTQQPMLWKTNAGDKNVFTTTKKAPQNAGLLKYLQA